MADYIYTLETRLSPDQQKAVSLVLDAAKAAEMNVYLTGGAIRDIITGFPIRDLDFTVQGNALKLQKDLERAGATIGSADSIGVTWRSPMWWAVPPRRPSIRSLRRSKVNSASCESASRKRGIASCTGDQGSSSSCSTSSRRTPTSSRHAISNSR